MFEQTLKLHWKSARWVMLPLVLLCFGLPQLAVRVGESLIASGLSASAADLLTVLEPWLPLFPLLAFLSGAAAGLTAWTWDHRVNHIYSLSLPVSRREYALLKMSAGAVILLLPAVAILAGTLMVSVLADVPDGLHVYAFSFTGRFLLASLISYALLFALAAGTIRTAVYVVSGAVLVLVFGTLLTGLLEDVLMIRGLLSPMQLLHAALTGWAGPLGVFGGNWMFIDV